MSKKNNYNLNELLINFISISLTSVVFVLVFVIILYGQLPDVKSLQNFSYIEPMRILTDEGDLIAEYGEIKRIPVLYKEIPKNLIYAIIATEDQRFFHHYGVDFMSIVRAALAVLKEGDKVQGASTITMQVARNFFLDRDKNFLRKIKEALLALEIEAHLSKSEIMELYCNQIFFGHRAYGIKAASLVYYGKDLKDLTVSEMAMLAGIPQAPSRHNPLSDEKRSLARRNHVLERMMHLGYLSKSEFEKAVKEPNTAKTYVLTPTVDAMYVADTVRQYWFNILGEEAYKIGLQIKTTIKTQHQKAANRAVIHGLEKKRGLPYEAPFNLLANISELRLWLKNQNLASDYDWGVITKINKNEVIVVTINSVKKISFPNIKGLEKIFIGAVVPTKNNTITQWALPEGALVNIDFETGAVTALVGGADWRRSHFNRALQAMRQSGSSFKPLLAAAALSQGYTLSSILPDEPFVAKIPGKNEYWRPQNVDKKFKGAISLRDAIIESRNLVMVHLLARLNIDKVLNLIDDIGIPRKDLPRSLAMSLGAGVVNPLQMAASFCVFGNKGVRIYPYLMTSVKDNLGNDIDLPFKIMSKGLYTRKFSDQDIIDFNLKQQVISPEVAWNMWKVLRETVERGTAKKALVIERSDIVGKTGTTNEKRDAWFVGLGGHYSAAVWCGYDQLQSLEYGAAVSLPIWIDFMRDILKGENVFVPYKPANLIEEEKKLQDKVEKSIDSSEDDWVNPDDTDILDEFI